MRYQKSHVEALMDAVRVHLVAWDSSEKSWEALQDTRNESLYITALELRLALRLLEAE